MPTYADRNVKINPRRKKKKFSTNMSELYIRVLVTAV